MRNILILASLVALGACSQERAPRGDRTERNEAAPAAPAARESGNRVAAAAEKPGSPAGDREQNEITESSGRELAEDSANLDFIIVNHTGRTITALSIQPEDDERWTNNILVQRDVPTDERAAASFTRDVEICGWRLRATFEGGETRTFPRVNLCDTIRVELR